MARWPAARGRSLARLHGRRKSNSAQQCVRRQGEGPDLTGPPHTDTVTRHHLPLYKQQKCPRCAPSGAGPAWRKIELTRLTRSSARFRPRERCAARLGVLQPALLRHWALVHYSFRADHGCSSALPSTNREERTAVVERTREMTTSASSSSRRTARVRSLSLASTAARPLLSPAADQGARRRGGGYWTLRLTRLPAARQPCRVRSGPEDAR